MWQIKHEFDLMWHVIAPSSRPFVTVLQSGSTLVGCYERNAQFISSTEALFFTFLMVKKQNTKGENFPSLALFDLNKYSCLNLTSSLGDRKPSVRGMCLKTCM